MLSSEILPKHELTAYKLKLLNSINPLLSPTLPPSPPLSHSDLSRSSPPLSTPATANATAKRKGAIEVTSGTSGLGLSSGVQNDEAPSKRARLSLSAKPRPPSANPEVKVSGSKADDTPDLRSSAFPSNSLVPPSPVLAGARPPTTHSSRQSSSFSSEWPSDRIRKLGITYRETARDLKRLGDKVARENKARKANLLSLVLLADALVLYVFAFWSDDHATKKVHSQNWTTIFGLLTFVRGAAEKSGIVLVGALCYRMEAYIIHLLSTSEQRSLVFRGAQVLSSSPSLLSTPTLAGPHGDRSPQSQGSPSSAQSPPNLIVPPASITHDLLKAYTKASHEIFRYQRLWDESAVALSPSVLSASFPLTWRLCVETNLDVDAASFVPPVKPWKFAWPVDLQQTLAIPHTVGFARALLEEFALKEGLEYVPQMVDG